MKRIALLIGLATGFSAFSQEKEDSIHLLPVEVRAIRASPTAPFAKTNLGKEAIRRQNLGQDLPFLLNQTPSVVVNSDAGNGFGYTGIRIRGTDATRINVTLNGIPYNDAESQGLFFVNLPDFASSVNSIQVQRGVGTSTNGAGAFGATINLSTNEVNKEAYVQLNNSFGSFNTWKNSVLLGSGLLDGHFTVDARLSRITSDGFIDRASSNLRSGYISTAYVSGHTNLRLNIFSGKEKTYQAWNGVSEADLKANRTINYAGTEKAGDPYHNETDNYKQDHYQLFFDQKLGKNWHFNTAVFLTKGRGYYEQYKAGEDYADYGMAYPVSGPDTTYSTDLVRQLWLDNDFYGTIFSLQYRTEGTELIIGGAGTRYNGDHFGEVIWAAKALTATGPWYRNGAAKKDGNLYAKWQQQLGGGLQIFTDLQFRKVDYSLNGFRYNPSLNVHEDFLFFNPKFGFSFSKMNWLLYASYSQANKEPNRDDFEASPSGIPRPEQLHDWEAGVENKGKGWAWSANLFYMKYRDQLVLTGKINDVGAYTRTNIGNSYRTGIELQGGFQFTSLVKANGNLTLSRNRIRNFSEFIDDYDNGGQIEKFYEETDISFSPDVTAAGTVTVTPAKSFSLDIISKYVGRQFLDNTSDVRRSLDAYYTQDLRAIYQFTNKWLKRVDLVLQVNNVFNKMYAPNGYTFSYYASNQFTTENYYFPMAGRNILAGLNVSF